jgi:CBS-domain-containing membrane protein
VTGIVTLRRVRSIAPDRRATLDASDVADPLGRVATATPDEPLASLLERMSTAAGDGRALVLDERSALVGIVSPTDIQRAIDIAALRAAPRSHRPASRPEEHHAVPQSA